MLWAGDPRSIAAPTLQIYVLPFIISSSARGSAAEIKWGDESPAGCSADYNSHVANSAAAANPNLNRARRRSSSQNPTAEHNRLYAEERMAAADFLLFYLEAS